MARHKVGFTVPERPLGRADVEFSIKRDGGVLGRLKVSKGSIEWVPKNKTLGYKLEWAKFDQLAQEVGTKER